MDQLGVLKILLPGAVQRDVRAHRDRQRRAALNRMENTDTPVVEQPLAAGWLKWNVRTPQPTDGNLTAVEIAASLSGED